MNVILTSHDLKILEKAFFIYEDVIEQISEIDNYRRCSLHKAHDITQYHDVDLGLCYLFNRLDPDFDKRWIRKYANKGEYICNPPTFCVDLDSLLYALRRRLNVLKFELEIQKSYKR